MPAQKSDFGLFYMTVFSKLTVQILANTLLEGGKGLFACLLATFPALMFDPANSCQWLQCVCSNCQCFEHVSFSVYTETC